MDSMLQRHCARYIYVIPDGLRELMSDISREVLRSQPVDMYTFIADYLDALLITRENARVAARLVESLTEMATTTAIFLEETGMPREEIDNIVSAIQRTFKNSIDSEHQRERLSEEVEEANIVSDILHEIDIDHEQAEIAAVIIQQAYRRFKERKEREKQLLAGLVDWRIAARSAIQLYRKTGVTNEEANRAATLIKAAYKGYYTRRLMKKIATLEHDASIEFSASPKEDESGEEEELEEDENSEKPKAVKINYDTVRPHVDFDTSESQAVVDQEPEAVRKLSTASSIAKHSLGFIFDAAIARITKQSVILEEEPIENSEEADNYQEMGDLADKTVPAESQELLHEEIRQEELTETKMTEEHSESVERVPQEENFNQVEDENTEIRGE